MHVPDACLYRVPTLLMKRKRKKVEQRKNE